ncbi:MAG: hypothetical protein Ct9H300mP32_3420 [Verrucomicrobiota bacterium]|nr:MAG: hypothetical protein Ct9H300mP32_3420 [Verrucomicrobiota bacterium]
MPYNFAARDYIQSGKLGDIRLVKVFNLKGGGPFHLGTSGSSPKGFSWKTWLGPEKGTAVSQPHLSRWLALFLGLLRR